MEVIDNKIRNQILKHEEQKQEMNDKLKQLNHFRKENWNLFDDDDKEMLLMKLIKFVF